MEDGDVHVDVWVQVKPLNGFWETNKQDAVTLKARRSLVYHKELPLHTGGTSQATSGTYKNVDYNLSSSTALRTSSSDESGWKKVSPRRKKPAESERQTKMVKIEEEQQLVKEPKLVEVEEKTEVKTGESSYEPSLEYWMVLALFWFWLFTLRYFHAVEMELGEGNINL